MSMFSGPTEHAANAPETWEVRKAGDRLWQLVTTDGTVINTYGTKKHATESIDLVWRTIYDRETRWYAGEQIDQWKPWATVKAEREATVRRLAERGRVGIEARVERLTRQLVSYYRTVTNDAVPADVVEWARWYGTTYPGLMGDDLVKIVTQIDADRAELTRTAAVLTDHAAA